MELYKWRYRWRRLLYWVHCRGIGRAAWYDFYALFMWIWRAETIRL